MHFQILPKKEVILRCTVYCLEDWQSLGLPKDLQGLQLYFNFFMLYNNTGWATLLKQNKRCIWTISQRAHKIKFIKAMTRKQPLGEKLLEIKDKPEFLTYHLRVASDVSNKVLGSTLNCVCFTSKCPGNQGITREFMLIMLQNQTIQYLFSKSHVLFHNVVRVFPSTTKRILKLNKHKFS